MVIKLASLGEHAPDVFTQRRLESIPKEIYVIQITTFDYGGLDSVQIMHHTFHEYYASRAQAEEKVKEFEQMTSVVIKHQYFIQTLWPAEQGPRIYIATPTNDVNSPN